MADAIPVHSEPEVKKPTKGSKVATTKDGEVAAPTPAAPMGGNPYKAKGGAVMPGPVKLIRQDF